MDRETTHDPYDGGVDSGGIPPAAKVRLPENVTKLRKKHRTVRDGAPSEDDREV